MLRFIDNDSKCRGHPSQLQLDKKSDESLSSITSDSDLEEEASPRMVHVRLASSKAPKFLPQSASKKSQNSPGRIMSRTNTLDEHLSAMNSPVLCQKQVNIGSLKTTACNSKNQICSSSNLVKVRLELLSKPSSSADNICVAPIYTHSSDKRKRSSGSADKLLIITSKNASKKPQSAYSALEVQQQRFTSLADVGEISQLSGAQRQLEVGYTLASQAPNENSFDRVVSEVEIQFDINLTQHEQHFESFSNLSNSRECIDTLWDCEKFLSNHPQLVEFVNRKISREISEERWPLYSKPLLQVNREHSILSPKSPLFPNKATVL